MTKPIFTDEVINSPEASEVLKGNSKYQKVIRGRTFEVTPLDAISAMNLLEVCVETFAPTLARAAENVQSLDIFTISEARVMSEPLMLLSEALKNKRFLKSMEVIIPAVVKENGASVEVATDFNGQLSVYLQLCWLIVKENVLDAFMECMEENGIDLATSMQSLTTWGQEEVPSSEQD